MMTVYTGLGNSMSMDGPCHLVNQYNICYVVQSCHGETISSSMDRNEMFSLRTKLNRYFEQGAKEVRIILGDEVVRTA